MRALLLLVALLGPLEGLDHAVAGWVQAHRRPVLETPMWAASYYARPVVVAGGLLVVLAVDLATGGGWATLRLAAVGLAGVNLSVEVLKRAVHRQRPDGEHNPRNASFPSSHAANAFVLASVLSLRWRRAAPLFFALALWVAFSRMYLNRHFLSDVVAGALLGMAFSWAAARWRPLRPPRVSGGKRRGALVESATV